MKRRIVLASRSPRRLEILRGVGLEPEVIVSDVDESIVDTSLNPSDYAMKLSSLKSGAVLDRAGDALVVGSDTVVVADGRILGQPADAGEAYAMLQSLSGGWHSVVSGLSVRDTRSGREETTFEETRVKFQTLTDEEIHSYIATGEPMDKAGAYGIQGLAGLFVSRIEGGYYNVVGLPLHKLYTLLKKFDVSLI